MPKRKLACITLDLEPDYAGQIPESYQLWTKKNVHQLTRLLEKYAIPLTCFVVGLSINKNTTIIQLFQNYDAEFHLHSNSHNLNEPDSEAEITQGKKKYKQYFNKQPMGYRAPEGRITREGLKRVKDHGFIFEASESPTYWPFVKNVLIKPRTSYQPIYGLWEIPFSVIGPLRILFTLSWVKLIGWNIYKLILTFKPLPNTIIFNFHLHDLWQASGYSQLSPFWKFIYSRNHHNSFEYFKNVIHFLQSQGYQFTTITQIVKDQK